MKLTFQLLFIFFTNVTFSQDYREATIIFNDSSRVKGYGEIIGNTIYFKLKQEAKPEKWSYDIAKGLLYSGYGYSEKYEYVKFENNKKPKLMEVIEEGKLTLYKDSKAIYRDDSKFFEDGKLLSRQYSTAYSKQIYYVRRKNAEFATDITFSFKFRSRIFFSDCKQIIEKINNGKFHKKNIPEMIYYYNDYCDESENEDIN